MEFVSEASAAVAVEAQPSEECSFGALARVVQASVEASVVPVAVAVD